MKITDTAAIIARARAAEGDRPPEERLFVDPFAHLFSGDLDESELADTFGAMPFLREQVRIRTRFIDDFVRRGLADGVCAGPGRPNLACRPLRP